MSGGRGGRGAGHRGRCPKCQGGNPSAKERPQHSGAGAAPVRYRMGSLFGPEPVERAAFSFFTPAIRRLVAVPDLPILLKPAILTLVRLAVVGLWGL
jgi:hypothetical protein